MEIGIDSFAARFDDLAATDTNDSRALNELLDRIVYADQVGLHTFGIGEHFRKEFLDSAPTLILAAAAARTKRIRLTSAVTVLAADDPVRTFQNFATLDLLSGGRAEIVVGRGSFTEAFPLFGHNLHDYDALFSEKLDLLLAIRDNEFVDWSGRFRPAMRHQPVYPRPLQQPLPIWLGMGGTPDSFIRAGRLGLPLMVAIIGGETHRYRPLVDLYRQAGLQAGHTPEQLQVGMHVFGYIGETDAQAFDEMYEGYAITMMGKVASERGMGPPTRSRFDAQTGQQGAFLVGSPATVAEKILRHSEALGGLSRITFQLDAVNLSHRQLLQQIDRIGQQVIPLVNAAVSVPNVRSELK